MATVKLISCYFQNGLMYVPEDKPMVSMYLSKVQLRELIRIEFGKAPKRSRILKKRLIVLVERLMCLVVDHIKIRQE